jgi:hypothetical protein
VHVSLCPGLFVRLWRRRGLREVDKGCREDEGYQMNDQHRVINEQRVIRGLASVASSYRKASLALLHPVEISFTTTTATRQPQIIQQNMHSTNDRNNARLPTNLHLLSLSLLETSELRCDSFDLRHCYSSFVSQQTGMSTLLVRIQHLFAAGEDAILSLPAEADLSLVLGDRWRIKRVDETTLSAAKAVAEDVGSVVKLSPMQIRTFMVTAELMEEL